MPDKTPPTPAGYRRLLAPPNYNRRVDVPDELVDENLRRGFKIDDTIEDDREQLRTALANSLVGKFAFVMASGPSMVAWPYDRVAALASLCTCWATNNAFNACGGLPVPRCHYLTILDRDFWDRHPEEIRGFVAQSQAIPCLCFQPSEAVRYLELAINPFEDITSQPAYSEGRYWNGKSSGIAACQMALHARPRAIFLLGHDCTVAAGKTHGSGVRSPDELRQRYPQGNDMLPGYTLLAAHAKNLGVEVYNLSPWSAVRDFPVIDIERAVRYAALGERPQ